jgi:hypothetical protein
MPFNVPPLFVQKSFNRNHSKMTNIPVGPPMPPMPMDMDEMHTRMPTSPYDIDPRDPRDLRTMSGPFDSRTEGLDYFSAVGMGPFSSRPPFLPSGFKGEMYTMGSGQHIDDLVRRYVIVCVYCSLGNRF